MGKHSANLVTKHKKIFSFASQSFSHSTYPSSIRVYAYTAQYTDKVIIRKFFLPKRAIITEIFETN